MQTESWWQSQTFKALVLYVATMVANAVARRWGYSLNTEEIAGLTVTVVGFIMGRQYKQGKLLDNEIHPLQVLPPAPPEPAPSAPSKIAPVVGLLLACALLLPATGCTGLRVRPDLGSKTVDCVGSALVSLAPEAAAALPKVAEAIQGGSADWQPLLDKAMVTGGMAAWCALMALLHSIEVGGNGGGEGATLLVLRPAEAGGLPPAVLLLRGYAYLDSRSR